VRQLYTSSASKDLLRWRQARGSFNTLLVQSAKVDTSDVRQTYSSFEETPAVFLIVSLSPLPVRTAR
jgi:hypothetical protein